MDYLSSVNAVLNLECRTLTLSKTCNRIPVHQVTHEFSDRGCAREDGGLITHTSLTEIFRESTRVALKCHQQQNHQRTHKRNTTEEQVPNFEVTLEDSNLWLVKSSQTLPLRLERDKLLQESL
jgi:hypothetical protein